MDSAIAWAGPKLCELRKLRSEQAAWMFMLTAELPEFLP